MSKPVRKKPHHLAYRHLFQVYIIFSVIFFLCLAIFVTLYPTFIIDIAISQFVQQFNNDWFTDLMKFVSWLGTVSTASVLLISMTVILILMRKVRDGGLLFFSVTGIYLISVLLKWVVGRPRPTSELVYQFSSHLILDSFPSGHVLFFMAFFGYTIFLVYVYLRNKLLKAIGTSILIILIFLIGLSRIYLGAHWFSDVLGAYLIGSAWLYFIIYLRKKLVPSV